MLQNSNLKSDDTVYKLDKSKKKKEGKCKAEMITEFLMISSDKVSADVKWLEANKVSHILNASGGRIKNVFDP